MLQCNMLHGSRVSHILSSTSSRPLSFSFFFSLYFLLSPLVLVGGGGRGGRGGEGHPIDVKM